MHAADVTQTCLTCIKNSNIQSLSKINEMDLMAIYIGSIIHDYKHPGLNNAFLINTANEIATIYNDISVLENYHIAEAFKLIRSDPKYDIFCLLTKEEKKIMRKKIVECVLSTDMTSHARYFSMIKLKVERYQIKKGKNSELIFSSNSSDINLPQVQQDFCSLILHFSDIANPAKPFVIYKNWMHTVVEEFFQQGDKEKALEYPISFLCDRNTVTIEGSQLGFIDGIVYPFAVPIIEIFPTLSFFCENIKDNKEIISYLKYIKEKTVKKENTSRRLKEIEDSGYDVSTLRIIIDQYKIIDEKDRAAEEEKEKELKEREINLATNDSAVDTKNIGSFDKNVRINPESNVLVTDTNRENKKE